MEENKTKERIESLQVVANQVDNFWTPEQIGVVQKNTAKGATFAELAYFLNVCKTMELNPFNKEVWCYKDGKGNLLIFSGRDGFLSKAQKNPLFNGIRSIEIRENDEYSIDVINNKIDHRILKTEKERGKILYGVAIVFRKGGEPTIEISDFDTYYKGVKYNGELIKTSPWNTHSAEMIKKVAESHALKKAFGISGIQSEYDFDKNTIKVKPIELTDKEIQGRLYSATSIKDINNLWADLTEKQQIDYEAIFNKRKKAYEL